MGLCEFGHDVLFVQRSNVFFRLAKCYVWECSGDIEAVLALVLMLSLCGLNDIPLLYVTTSLVDVLV